MKEATGELNMTLVTVIAVAAILVFVTQFVPRILNGVNDRWTNAEQNGNNSMNTINNASGNTGP